MLNLYFFDEYKHPYNVFVLEVSDPSFLVLNLKFHLSGSIMGIFRVRSQRAERK
jgi:hypothetical protein